MAIAARLKEFLDKEGVRYRVISHSPAYTAQEIAAELHVSGKVMVKTVVLKTRDTFAMAALPANERVDVGALSQAMGGVDCVMATEAEFQSLFPGCEVGAMPPFGNLYGLPVYVAQELTTDDEIVFNCGTHTEAIRMKYVDFERLVLPKIAGFGKPGNAPGHRWWK